MDDRRKSRSSCEKPFIGHSEENVPDKGLPSTLDVLRVISHEREKPKCSKKSVPSMCCPSVKERNSQCLLEGGCLEKGDPCLLLKVKRKWNEAGIITVSDVRIKEKLTKINIDYGKILKNKSKVSDAAEEERRQYKENIEKTFDIKDPNARLSIINDVSRSDQDKEEDLAFFDDYLGPNASRKWRLADRDFIYEELVEEAAISIKFLGADPPRFTFKVPKPKTVSNARFMQIAEYYITMELLSRQLNFLSDDQKKEVSEMAFFCSLFYGPEFLMSGDGVCATFNDLSSMLNYRNLRVYMPQAADKALATWNRHLDFLTPQHIVISLVNDQFSNFEREDLARALLNLLPNRNHNLPPTRVVYPGPNFSTNDAFWPANGGFPRISQFVTLDSFLIFNMLDFEDDGLRAWWQSPVDQWSADPNSPNYKPEFHQLFVYASKHQWTNDAAERAIKSIKDAIGRFHIEENFQETLLTQSEERKRVKASRNGQLTKRALNNILE